jgi:DNA-binding transcriptional LysR family regulator
LLSEGAAQLHSEQTAISGPIRITAPGDLVRSCLLPWIDDFLRENPAVTISVFAHDAVLDLMKSEIDIALRYGELEDSSSASRRLAIAQLTVCAAPQYLRRSPSIKKPQDLAQHNCLTFFRDGRPDRVWNFSRQGRKEKVNVNGDRFLDDASLAREWAVQGAGIILLSSLNVRGDILAGRLVPVLKDWDAGDYPLNAVMPSSKYRPKRIEVFLNYLIQKFAEKRPTSS